MNNKPWFVDTVTAGKRIISAHSTRARALRAGDRQIERGADAVRVYQLARINDRIVRAARGALAREKDELTWRALLS